ncbi:hypothetical protein V6Z12_A02G048900 [Gossypium hirsutum]
MRKRKTDMLKSKGKVKEAKLPTFQKDLKSNQWDFNFVNLHLIFSSFGFLFSFRFFTTLLLFISAQQQSSSLKIQSESVCWIFWYTMM